MESANHADESQLNIQNVYFNNARKNRMRVTVVLTTGQRISGLIRSFDRFTVILDTRQGDQMVFKHAIATVAPAFAGERDHRGKPQRGAERPDGRPAGAPQHRPGPPPSRDGAGPPGGPRSEVKPRGTSGPQGRSFGNFMDLSAVRSAAEKPEKPAEPAAADGPAGGPDKEPKSAPAQSSEAAQSAGGSAGGAAEPAGPGESTS